MAKNLKQSRITWRGLPLLALLVVLLYLLYQKMNYRTKMTITNDFGKDLYLRLIEAGINPTMSGYLVAQAAHETANFTSDIFKENNNLFGMKLPKVRQTTATGENRGHATFKDIESCIEDMRLYLKYMGYLSTYSSIEKYIESLKEKRYFTDTIENYTKGMKYFYTLYFG